MKHAIIKLLATSAALFSLAEVHAAGAEEQRLIDRYAEFAGSPENAASLVTGLRSGSAVTLADGVTTTATTFSPPTGQMGWGNVQRALDLARAELAAQGITNPTPTQLQTALVGSTTTPGILQLRSEGGGWGQIAHQLKVSPSGRIEAPTADARAIDVQTRGAIVTAAGTRVIGTAATGTRSDVRMHSGAAHSPVAKGIVTGGGSLAGSPRQSGGGKANGHRSR